MKNCPLCAEEVQDAAIKCKHCGGDLKTKKRFFGGEARDVAQGIKKKEWDESSFKAKLLVVIIFSAIFGYIFRSWGVGIVLLLVLGWVAKLEYLKK